jgi:predicted nuclease of predicted toxin-antitoxin system
MKLLLDQGLPRSAAALLRESGVDAVHAGEIGLATAEDAVILENARQEQRIVVTLDADFHMLLAVSAAASPAVIRVRLSGLRAVDVVDLLPRILADWGEVLEKGAVLSVQRNRVRVRRLPL